VNRKLDVCKPLKTGQALKTCQDIVNVRVTQREACEKDLHEEVLKGRVMLGRVHDIAKVGRCRFATGFGT
jgi:hypothetical protein